MTTHPCAPLARWLVANLDKPGYNAWSIYVRYLVEAAGSDEVADALLHETCVQLAQEDWSVRVQLRRSPPPSVPGFPPPPLPIWRTDWHD